MRKTTNQTELAEETDTTSSTIPVNEAGDVNKNSPEIKSIPDARTKIDVTVPQKEIVLSFFKDDIQLIQKYYKLISSDTDKDFKYFVFKEFVFSAAGMMRHIDQDFYNAKLLNSFKVIQALDDFYTEFKAKSKHVHTVYTTQFLLWQEDYVSQKDRYCGLKDELSMLITSEQIMSAKLKSIDAKIVEQLLLDPKYAVKEEEETKTKFLRREHVDTIHSLGERRKELDRLQILLSNFEEEHQSLFNEYFFATKKKLDAQYHKTLDYFGFKFNNKLFSGSKNSDMIQKFKKQANISGELNLCKYVEYYLKNVNPDTLSDKDKKESLNIAKQYCKNKRERENLF